jgi:hypothetical protein
VQVVAGEVGLVQPAGAVLEDLDAPLGLAGGDVDGQLLVVDVVERAAVGGVARPSFLSWWKRLPALDAKRRPNPAITTTSTTAKRT